jgi:hypothetical protein
MCIQMSFECAYKKYIIFLMQQKLIHDHFGAETLYNFLSILSSSNEKTQN